MARHRKAGTIGRKGLTERASIHVLLNVSVFDLLPVYNRDLPIEREPIR